MIDFSPRIREQRIADLTATMSILHNLKQQQETNEGKIRAYNAWKHEYQQRELYMTNALCAHCWQNIHNPDYDQWIHLDGEILCGEEGHEAEPAVTPWMNIGRAA